MTEHTFRSALNGFNREDVVRYLEYINAQHAAEVNQLRSELEYLRSKETPAPTGGNEVLLEQQAARIRELFDRCNTQEKTIAQLNARLAAVPAEKSSAESELEAYRRAERAERIAQERADQIYRQANAVIADATIKVDDAVAIVSSIADQLTGQLDQFQSAVTDSKQALQNAAATLYAIRPSTENE